MAISLIANSGIQFHKFKTAIKPNDDLIGTVGFYEKEDLINARVSVQYACYLPEHDCWIPKDILIYHNYLDEKNQVSDSINPNIIKPFKLTEDRDYFTISSIQTCFEYFCSTEDKLIWLPLPYFKKNTDGQNIFGPVSWARMMIKEVKTDEKPSRNMYQAREKQYHVVLAFDTKLADREQAVYYAPLLTDTNEDGNVFNLCSNEDLLLNFCNAQYGCDWVDRYIKYVVHGNSAHETFPVFDYLGYYLYFVKYLSRLTFINEDGETQKVFPEITLFPDAKAPVEVDLVLDIGNSNTCGILFESPGPAKPFSFTNVKKLRLNNLSQPEKEYDNPFSMRLAFVETRFGEMGFAEHHCFKWPSLVRLGEEASYLINKYYKNQDEETETATHHSSPKRYLWDTKKTPIPWKFINNKYGNNINIYCEGISEQFKADGEYATDGESSYTSYYSRKSLMTFVFIEILLHAISQVNSHEFRTAHGNREAPRRIKRITITCPTSIIQKEQITLRETANIAIRTLRSSFSNSFLGSFEAEEASITDLEIVPSPKDLSRKLDQIGLRKDWIYDEATCSQLVFLYGEISKRYLNDASTFFRLYGKVRSDVTYTDKRALTIASIDIGGGTTDLMTCAYQYEDGQNLAYVKPHPLYWESFNFAGDDLLKEIVQQILLEGQIDSEADENVSGIIANAARQAGVKNVSEKMQNFFGSDSARQDYITRIRRKNFVVQVSVPIALKYLQHAIDEKPDEVIGFYDFFGDTPPSPDLIKHFNQAFAPLKLEEVKWKLSKKRVAYIVETTFDPLIKQLSGLVAAYGCDFLLLAGKPTTLPKIREMFIKYFSVSPERIISLSKNKYRVGRWYPFADDLGFVDDPKTMVSVGALIALMGGKLDRLDGFRINTQLLKQGLISTADNIGEINKYSQLIDNILISPDANNCEIEIHSLPVKLGYKQLPNKHYRARPIYKLEFNEDEIKRRVIEQDPYLANNEMMLPNAVQNYKTTLKDLMPFKVRLQRNWTESKEDLVISRITDSGRNERSKQILSLSVMTLADEYSYWLDTGEFVLNLK